MTAPLYATPGPEINVRVMQVTAVVEQLDARAAAVMRRVVPRSARSRRPDGTVVMSLARLRVLVDALTAAGYDVRVHDEGDAPVTDYQDVWSLYGSLDWPALPLPRGQKWPPPVGFTGRAGVDPTPEQCARFEQDRRYRGTTQTALRMPHTVMGIDRDCYGGRTGAETIREAERRWGALPPGPCSSSREDGSSIAFYRVPAQAQLVSEIKFPELNVGHVEIIRRVHRYAVVWPSVHPATGAPYTWRGTAGPDRPPAVDDLSALPQAWLDGLNLARYVAPAPPVRSGPQPALTNARVAGILRRVTTAEPDTRNSLLSWGAGRLFQIVRDGELDAATAEQLLHDAARMIHRPDHEAVATIRSARRWALGA